MFQYPEAKFLVMGGSLWYTFSQVTYMRRRHGVLPRAFHDVLRMRANNKRGNRDMEIRYKSTRSEMAPVSASQAILKGLSEDGGLFVPEQIPPLPCSLRKLAEMDYRQVAYEVMKPYFGDFTQEELKACIAGAYDDKFDTEAIAPLAKVEGVYYLELFHGPTIAFKDMALSILPYLMTTAMKKNGGDQEVVILTATSGDTGKAALAGFADVPGTRIIVFYPKDGISAIQKQQMLTQKGKNVAVVGVDGNFDDCQNGVKAIFGNAALREEMAQAGLAFSSANSINIGRLVPQIAYYVYAYARLLREGEIAEGEEIHIAVPTGNFGNILAAYYARRMGLPVKKLLCASNENKVLYDFFATGSYDRKRPFILTSSPSMDILISSNLERLIYEITGFDAKATAAFMQSLAGNGSYEITKEMKQRLEPFYGGFATEEEGAAEIAGVFDRCGYVMDTHTAVASAVASAYRKNTGDTTKMLVASTASPYKFAPSILRALKPEFMAGAQKAEPDNKTEPGQRNGERRSAKADDETKAAFACVDELSRLSGMKIPAAVEELRSAKLRHRRLCPVEGMEAEVKDLLNLVR